MEGPWQEFKKLLTKPLEEMVGIKGMLQSYKLLSSSNLHAETADNRQLTQLHKRANEASTTTQNEGHSELLRYICLSSSFPGHRQLLRSYGMLADPDRVYLCEGGLTCGSVPDAFSPS